MEGKDGRREVIRKRVKAAKAQQAKEEMVIKQDMIQAAIAHASLSEDPPPGCTSWEEEQQRRLDAEMNDKSFMRDIRAAADESPRKHAGSTCSRCFIRLLHRL